MIFFSLYLTAQDTASDKTVKVRYLTGESSARADSVVLGLKSCFFSSQELFTYLNQLPSLLTSLGYLSSSVDSVYQENVTWIVKIYLGIQFKKIELKPSGPEAESICNIACNEISWPAAFSLPSWHQISERILNSLENSGYPFAKIRLDSVVQRGDIISGLIFIEKGILYRIDSISNPGDAKISKSFLYHYLNIPPTSVFDRSKLNAVDNKIKQLPFISSMQPSDLTMLGSGAVLNLYLKNKKCSQFNFLLGLQSSTQGKLTFTGDLLLDLKNQFSKGENIFLKWQQLLPGSPRLNLGFSQPYFLNTSLGPDLSFELYKRDSNFLMINARIGVQFKQSYKNTIKFFFQWQKNNLLSAGADTVKVKRDKKLPDIIDSRSVNFGCQWIWQNLSDLFNPRKGNDINISVVGGNRVVERNADILSINDNGFNYSKLYDSVPVSAFQIRITGMASHYFPIKKSAVWKSALQFGVFHNDKIFRNDLFQIGGFKTIRGFDEESIFASAYLLFTNEYRLLFAKNSYISFFVDLGKTAYRVIDKSANTNFVAAGCGLMYETKAGLLNINYAIGKRNDVPFKLGNASKIHFGYINYF